MAFPDIELTDCSILIIDDSEIERRWICQVLAKEGIFSKFFEAIDGLQGFRIFLAKRPDIVLCDMVMPRHDGVTFLKMRQAQLDKALKLIPIIVLTAIDNLPSKLTAFEMGAHDYILKPIDPMELVARVKVHLKAKKLQEHLIHQYEQLQKQNRYLWELSTIDSLTGLYNRRHILERCEEYFANAMRYQFPISVCMFDIDRFKSINDTYGHQAGDQVLQAFAEILRMNVRRGDLVGRYGGEEFLALLPYVDTRGAVAFADRVRKTVRKLGFTFQQRSITITVSGGVASFPDIPAASAWELIQHADAALYKAKGQGRDQVCIATLPVAENTAEA